MVANAICEYIYPKYKVHATAALIGHDCSHTPFPHSFLFINDDNDNDKQCLHNSPKLSNSTSNNNSNNSSNNNTTKQVSDYPHHHNPATTSHSTPTNQPTNQPTGK